MTKVLAHRGPDDAGTLILRENLVALGHRRLSILDLSPAGHQPMTNEAGDKWITYNGEVYNYKEIRARLEALGHRFRSNTDTEVLLHAYDQWGEACLSMLNGMFAFAIYDQRNRKLFAARDQLGIKPFYYYEKNGLLVFASEIKSILANPMVQTGPDYFALHNPARFHVSPHTGFASIKKLPPGFLLEFVDGALSVRPYWDLHASESAKRNEREAIAQLDSLLNESVRGQMIADVPVGVFLSGGLDSSVVSALMRRNTTNEVHAFTIRFSEVDQKFEAMPDDSYYARKVASDLGFAYHEFEIQPRVEELLPKLVWHMDEPLSDPAAINTYLISSAAREAGIVVLLNGMGGDEIFGGYRKHLACLGAQTYQRMLPRSVRGILESGARALPVATSGRGLRYARWAKRFLTFASLPDYERYLASDLSLSQEQYKKIFRGSPDYAHSHFYTSIRKVFDDAPLSYLTRMCVADTKFFLPEHNLTYSDKASMAAGVESRPPLTDPRIVEFMFSLAPRFRIRRLEQKYLLKKVAERYLPRSIVYRPKAPFGSPLRSWIRGPLAPMVDDLLSDDAIRKRGLYEASYVREVIAKDRRGEEDNALLIWSLLTTEVWFQKFFG
jgi:asparagine synthase (glutamine-hydrolysing)